MPRMPAQAFWTCSRLRQQQSSMSIPSCRTPTSFRSSLHSLCASALPPQPWQRLNPKGSQSRSQAVPLCARVETAALDLQLLRRVWKLLPTILVCAQRQAVTGPAEAVEQQLPSTGKGCSPAWTQWRSTALLSPPLTLPRCHLSSTGAGLPHSPRTRRRAPPQGQCAAAVGLVCAQCAKAFPCPHRCVPPPPIPSPCASTASLLHWPASAVHPATATGKRTSSPT